MNKKDKQIVKKVGCTMENVYACYTRDIEEYTELIRADENKACAKHYLEIMRDAVEQAVLREREACAKLCEELDDSQTNQSLLELSDCAEAIRQRGEK